MVGKNPENKIKGTFALLIMFFMFVGLAGIGSIILSFTSKVLINFWTIEKMIGVIVMMIVGNFLTISLVEGEKNENYPRSSFLILLIFFVAALWGLIGFIDFIYFLLTFTFFIGWSGISFILGLLFTAFIPGDKEENEVDI